MAQPVLPYQPYVAPQGFGPVGLHRLFNGAVEEQINAIRLARDLPKLTAYKIGQEYLPENDDAPRIVIVPTGARFGPGRVTGTQPEAFKIGQRNPKVRYNCWLQFTAHLWGDPSPSALSTVPGTIPLELYDFASTMELQREFLISIADNLGNVPNVLPTGMRWEQPRDTNRRGRLALVDFEVGVPITDEPYAALTIANPGVPGTSVQIDATVTENFADGSQVNGPTFTAP